MTSQRDAALGEPAFWRPAEPEGTPEEAQETEDGGAADHDFTPVEPHPGYFDAPVVEEAVFSPQPAATKSSAPAETAAVAADAAPARAEEALQARAPAGSFVKTAQDVARERRSPRPVCHAAREHLVEQRRLQRGPQEAAPRR